MSQASDQKRRNAGKKGIKKSSTAMDDGIYIVQTSQSKVKGKSSTGMTKAVQKDLQQKKRRDALKDDSKLKPKGGLRSKKQEASFNFQSDRQSGSGFYNSNQNSWSRQSITTTSHTGLSYIKKPSEPQTPVIVHKNQSFYNNLIQNKKGGTDQSMTRVKKNLNIGKMNSGSPKQLEMHFNDQFKVESARATVKTPQMAKKVSKKLNSASKDNARAIDESLSINQ